MASDDYLGTRGERAGGIGSARVDARWKRRPRRTLQPLRGTRTRASSAGTMWDTSVSGTGRGRKSRRQRCKPPGRRRPVAVRTRVSGWGGIGAVRRTMVTISASMRSFWYRWPPKSGLFSIRPWRSSYLDSEYVAVHSAARQVSIATWYSTRYFQSAINLSAKQRSRTDTLFSQVVPVGHERFGREARERHLVQVEAPDRRHRCEWELVERKTKEG